MNNQSNVGLIGMSNGYELVVRYMHERMAIVPEEVVVKASKLSTLGAVQLLEQHDPTVRFVDYTPCDAAHVLTFGSARSTIRVTPMWSQQAAYTVTLDNEDAYTFVRDLIGSNMYHVTSTPA